MKTYDVLSKARSSTLVIRRFLENSRGCITHYGGVMWGEIFLIADVTGKASKRNHIGVLEVKRGGKRLRA